MYVKNIVLNFFGVGKDVFIFIEVQFIVDQIVQFQGDYFEVEIFYNKFINVISYEFIIIEGFFEEVFVNFCVQILF